MKDQIEYLIMLTKAAFVKNILYLKRYWLNTLFGIVIMALFFMGLTFGVSELSSSFIKEEPTALISGYVCWMFMSASFSTMVTNITNEATLGTLEQLYINSKSFILTLLTQALSNAILIWIQFFILISIVVMFGFSPAKVIVGYLLFAPQMFLGVLSLWGAGFIVASLALEHKNISSIYTALSTILFGAISYFSQNNDSWQFSFVPFASTCRYFNLYLQGDIRFDGVTLCEIMLNSTACLLIGVKIFTRSIARSKKIANFAKH